MRKDQAKGHFHPPGPDGVERDLERLRDEIENEEVPGRLEELGRRLEQLIKLKRASERPGFKR